MSVNKLPILFGGLGAVHKLGTCFLICLDTTSVSFGIYVIPAKTFLTFSGGTLANVELANGMVVVVAFTRVVDKLIDLDKFLVV